MLRALIVLLLTTCAFAQPVKYHVDATDAPRALFHATVDIPAHYFDHGRLTFAYPRWIPGEHGPTGVIANLAGIFVEADGARIGWRRDPHDVYLHHCDVPGGTKTVRVKLDYLANVGAGSIMDSPLTSDALCILDWALMLVYPLGPTDEIEVEPSVTLPDGWSIGGNLSVEERDGPHHRFAPVSLTELVDNPMVAGRHYRHVDLGEFDGIPHEIHIVADSADALEISEDRISQYRSVVTLAREMCGPFPYREYHFLVTLSDSIGFTGLEHHECSLNGMPERGLVDSSMLRQYAFLLPHEYVHSWNGRYRLPEPMKVDDFQEPLDTSLLWVYEGLTNYLGNVLNARAGLWSEYDFLEYMAHWGAFCEHRVGRLWRPLQDTAIGSQFLYAGSSTWGHWRRAADYYREGDLIWLEVDTIIRERTQGTKSIDDFARAFFGTSGGKPIVSTYTDADVYEELSSLVSMDWEAFFRERLDSTSPRAPLAGITNAGYRLIYTDEPNAWGGADDLRFSLGLRIRGNGTISDVLHGKPAFVAGLGPGMSVMAVNGRRFTMQRLRDAIEAKRPIEMIVANGDEVRTATIDYRSGPRYPHLERIEGVPDLMLSIIAPGLARP